MVLSLPQLDGSQDSRELFYLMPQLIEKQGGSKIYKNEISQALHCLVGECTKYLPCRSGYSVALDAATSCITDGIREVLRGKSSQPSPTESKVTILVNPSMQVTRSYIAAIIALRHSLDNRRLSSMPEIILATLLICYFEVNVWIYTVFECYYLNNVLTSVFVSV